MDSAILEVKNLSVKIGDAELLSGVSFSVQKGETVIVIGPNGAGKTTLFRALIGAISYSGNVTWAQSVDIGYVPQKVDLERDLPITIEEFFLLKSKKKFTAGEIKEALTDVKLPEAYLKKPISELSSGELQRVLIAWAILGHPKMLLFDEPTASIDVAGQETVYELLHNLQDTHDLTLIMISHDLSTVNRYATQVLCINKEQICYGAPEEVLTPEGLSKLYGSEQKFYHHMHNSDFHA